MMTQPDDALVDDYLGRLAAAAWPLPPDRQADLVDGIREHIAEARAAGAADEASIRGVLERLGRPEDIAEAAAREGGAAIPPYPLLVQRPSLAHETWTVCLLTVGNLVLPVISWLAGAVLLVAGKRWRWWEKLLGLLVVPGGPVGALLAFSLFYSADDVQHCTVTGNETVCTGTTHLVRYGGGVLAGAFVLLAPLAVSFFLYRRAKARAAVEPPYRSLG
ncbi:MAG: hypothetical protein JWO22_1408 [Frankiales bacterium]|nr:hypothetical protein [Frankiales bacterium]